MKTSGGWNIWAASSGTRYGIDVSSFQGEIDWDAVADDNIDFAMVRVGFRGTGTAA